MNQTEGRASGEVRGEPARPDLARQIAEKVGYERYPDDTFDEWMGRAVPLVRESLAPIREALEEGWSEALEGEYEDGYHALQDRVAEALRLLRGEELSGNRGIDGGK